MWSQAPAAICRFREAMAAEEITRWQKLSAAEARPCRWWICGGGHPKGSGAAGIDPVLAARKPRPLLQNHARDLSPQINDLLAGRPGLRPRRMDRGANRFLV